MQAKLGAVLLLALPLLAILEVAARRAKRSTNRSAIELLAGVQTGLCIGVGNATLASGLQSTSKSWLEHVAREHIGSRAWPHTSLASSRWIHLLFAGLFVLCGALLNASHPLFANRGYQHGRVVLISIYTALVSMATGVLMGVSVLDEAWPTRPLMSFLRHLAFVLIVGGVWSLNWANIKARPAGHSTYQSPILAHPLDYNPRPRSNVHPGPPCCHECAPHPHPSLCLRL